MRAVLCVEHGPPERLVVRDMPSPVAEPGQVVVDVRAASINFPDLLIIQDKYQFKPPLPFSPGSELAGVVRAVGRDVTEVQPGDRVMAFTLYGAFAEQLAIDAARVMPVPDDVPDEVAASLLVTHGTMEHALSDRAGLVPGESVLVLGASGGVGLAAIELAKVMGATVVAGASSEAKLAVCRERGADHTIDYRAPDWRRAVADITGGRGVDVVVDPVGGRFSEPALRSLAWRGRLLVVGFAAGEIPRLPLNLVLLKGASIVGVFWGEFARREPERFRQSVTRLIEWYRRGAISPVIADVVSLDGVPEALTRLHAREVIGKIVVKPGVA